MDKLPNDILFEISKHLYPEDIINLFIYLKKDVPLDIVNEIVQRINKSFLLYYGCDNCYCSSRRDAMRNIDPYVDRINRFCDKCGKSLCFENTQGLFVIEGEYIWRCATHAEPNTYLEASFCNKCATIIQCEQCLNSV